jgi:hypothetical protein
MKVLPIAILSWLLLGPLGALSAIGAVLGVVRGEYVTAVVAVGVSAFCFGLIIPLVKVVRGNVTPHGTFDGAGTTIRPDSGIDIPVQIALLGLVVACALIAVLAPLGKLDIPMPSSVRFSAPFTSGLIVVTTAPMLWRNVLRGSTKYLRLTPDGFEMVQGWRSQSGDWAQVVEVTEAAPGQSAPTPNTIVVVVSDGSAPTMAAASYTPNGVALRQLVRFYWLKPTQRSELTDGRALKRFRDEQFGVDVK